MPYPKQAEMEMTFHLHDIKAVDIWSTMKRNRGVALCSSLEAPCQVQKDIYCVFTM